jgi:alkyl sulfatase BDS1-like metallo-beta-lactamase superfamily hydrolase
MRAEPDLEEAKLLEARAFELLAAEQRSANGRHYYLSRALELRGEIEIEQGDLNVSEDLLRSFPVGNVMRAMSVNLDPEKSLDADTVVGFRFPDVGEAFTIHVRRGVAEVSPVFPEEPDIAVTVDSLVWKEILIGKRNPLTAFASDDVAIEGGTVALVGFLRMFR